MYDIVSPFAAHFLQNVFVMCDSINKQRVSFQNGFRFCSWFCPIKVSKNVRSFRMSSLGNTTLRRGQHFARETVLRDSALTGCYRGNAEPKYE